MHVLKRTQEERERVRVCVCVCVQERKAKCIVLFLSKSMLFLSMPLFHFRKYLDMYFADSVKKIYNFVDKAMNGEDLMMNAIVSNYTSQFKFRLPCHALVVDVQRREIAKDGEDDHIHLNTASC